MNNLLLVFLGGGIGSLLRYSVGIAVRDSLRTGFPMATLLSNILSCILLAVVVGPLSDKIGPGTRIFLVVGICGGFSTFSTFSFETVELMRSGNFLVALANILISVAVCVTLIWFVTKQS
jgi:fluoride exporter